MLCPIIMYIMSAKDLSLVYLMWLFFILTCLPIIDSESVISPRDMLARVGMTHSKPEQIHITFGATFRDVIIMWSSSVHEKSLVEFGNGPDSVSKVESKVEELKEHSEKAKKFIHRAELKSLDVGSRYTYRIVDVVSGIKSENYKFDVPHDDPKKSHTFMVLADMGLLTKSLQFVFHEALSHKYEAVFHIGDIAYNLDSEDGALGDRYMNKVQKMASVVPYLTTPGDHERFFDFYHYRHRFSTPNAGWPMKEEELWYSFDIGHAHFISLNTESMYNDSRYVDKQMTWLKNDLKLANDNRHSHPWIIVLGHKPLYCTTSIMEQECDKENSQLRMNLEDLFFQHGVDTYLSGHKHCYERSWPMYKNHHFQTDYINPGAPVYMIIGAMGYEYLTDKQNSHPAWLAFAVSNRDKELYVKLSVVNASHLLWTVYNAFNNEVVDFIQIVQNHHGSFGEPGQEALNRIHPAYQQARDKLPPIPYTIVDEPSSSFLSLNRRLLLIFTVFSLSLILFFFLKNSKVRKVLRLHF